VPLDGHSAAVRDATPALSTVRFHPLVWPAWLIGAVVAVGTNPLHNLLVVLGAVLVAMVCHSNTAVGRALGVFMRIGVVVLVLRVLLSCVAVGGFSFGETPVGRLPMLHLPWWLGGLALGGPWTLEMLALGIVFGLRLLTLLALFGAFNAAVDHYGLLRRVPNVLRGAGLVVTIALAFVPQTFAQLVAIREAQQVRGHRFRTWRDALPLVSPLLSGGLERSLQLAEAMDSRGYGARRSGARYRPGLEKAATVVGLTLLAFALFFVFFDLAPWRGVVLLVAAGMTLGWAAWSAERAARGSRYLRDRWNRRDLVAVAASVALVMCVLLVRALAPETMLYTPLPRAAFPPFELWSIVLVGLLAVPAALTLVEEQQARRAEGEGAWTA
jgi:energy-coupling factor transport system permease protein